MRPAPPRTRTSPRHPAALFWRARDGVAAVEFALIAPLLILLLGGAVSLGEALRVRIAVGNAARAGAAWAQLNGFDANGIAAAARAATALTGVAVTATASAASCTSPASLLLAPAGGATLCPATGAPPGTYVSVATSVPYTSVIPLPGLPTTTTITGAAVARVR
ncbi:MAG: TadE/TadG family type IV pilus assembly protein [Janthinobacterium lividum]